MVEGPFMVGREGRALRGEQDGATIHGPAFEPPAASRGRRVLMDRVSLRGVSCEHGRLDDRRRELALRSESRRWFGQDPDRFAVLRRPQRSKRAAQERSLRELSGQRSGQGALVYAAHDTEPNETVGRAETLLRRTESQ
jgi:uncharacterized protein YeaO (DUF488 family)